MKSLWTLFRTQPLLRESCVIGALVFASFSCFWTTLAFLLHSHYGLGAGVAGTFGLLVRRVLWLLRLAGRLADKHGSRWVVSVGMALLAASYFCCGARRRRIVSTAFHLVALVIGVIVLDMGAQMTQVANQTRIFGLVPSARSRLNTVYMTVYFSGAAAGSALATIAWVHWGGMACAACAGADCLAAMWHATGQREGRGSSARSRGEDVLMEA